MSDHATDLTTTRDGAVEYLTLNRPEVRNAFNEHVIAELTDMGGATLAARRAARVRAVVLAGAGKAFCAGADVAWMAKTVATPTRRICATRRRCRAMFGALDALPVPLIGRVHGAALGGGAGLAAVCDIVVADDDAHVRVHRGEAGHPAGGDLAVRAARRSAGRPRASCS